MRKKIIVSGLKCSSCASSVQQVLKKANLTEVNVDFMSGDVWFENPSNVSHKAIKRAINKLGYTVEEESESKDAKKTPSEYNKIRLYFLLSLALTIPLWLHMFLSSPTLFHNHWFQLLISVPIYILCSIHYGKSGVKTLLAGSPNMDLLIWFSTSSAFFFSIYLMFFRPDTDMMFFETGSSIVTFVFLGQWVEMYSISKTNSVVKTLMKKQPMKVKRKKIDDFETIDVYKVGVGDTVLSLEGETLACDGKVISGSIYVNESLLTGESNLILKKAGDDVFAGSLNEKGQAEIIVSKNASENTIAAITGLINKAKSIQPNIQRIGDVVASYFVPSVVIISVSIFLLLYFVFGLSLQIAIMNSITVMVIACPCAVGLATPTAIVVGIGELTKLGFFVKKASAIEILSKAQYMIFDKTGTLTDGNFKVNEVWYLSEDKKEEINNLIFSLEEFSTHPIAISVLREFESKKTKHIEFKEVNNIRGKGLEAEDSKGNKYKLGRFDNKSIEGFSFMLIKNDEVIAKVKMEDSIKEGAIEMMTFLKERRIIPIMLSGDKKSNCLEVGKKLGFDIIKYECTPKDKMETIREFQQKGIVIMLGDGLNDAPSLHAAHSGIAFASPGDLSAVDSDILIVRNDLISVVQLLDYCNKILHTIKGNYLWAISYNLVAIPLASIGLFTPTMGAFIMAFSDVVVVGNSLLLKLKKIKLKHFTPIKVDISKSLVN